MSQELTPQQLTFIEENYLKAFDIFLKTQPLARAGSKNFFACVDYLKSENIDPSCWDFHVFLTALTMIAADGKLDREMTPQERQDRERRLNRERELKDRRDGNIGTNRGHTLVDDKPVDPEEVKTEVQQLLKAAAQYREAEESVTQTEAPTASDALMALQTILDPVQVLTATRETQRQIELWIRTSDSKHYVSIRAKYPDLRSKMDRVLAKQIIED